jgi:hypothetical protein
MASGRSLRLSSFSHGCSASSARCLIEPRTPQCTGCTRQSDLVKSRASSFPISGSSTVNCRTLPQTLCAGRRPTLTLPISTPCRTNGSTPQLARRATDLMSRASIYSRFDQRSFTWGKGGAISRLENKQVPAIAAARAHRNPSRLAPRGHRDRSRGFHCSRTRRARQARERSRPDPHNRTQRRSPSAWRLPKGDYIVDTTDAICRLRLAVGG